MRRNLVIISFYNVGTPSRYGVVIFRDSVDAGCNTLPSTRCYGSGAKIKALDCLWEAESYGNGCRLLYVGVYGRKETSGSLKTVKWQKVPSTMRFSPSCFLGVVFPLLFLISILGLDLWMGVHCFLLNWLNGGLVSLIHCLFLGFS